MPSYYVNERAQTGGEREVHRVICQWLPSNREHVGNFDTDAQAMEAARAMYPKVDGCAKCMPDCHTC